MPYLLDVQNSYLGIIAITMVIPLHSAHRFDMLARNLNPVFEIKGQSVVTNTAGLGSIPLAELRRPVGNMAQ